MKKVCGKLGMVLALGLVLIGSAEAQAAQGQSGSVQMGAAAVQPERVATTQRGVFISGLEFQARGVHTRRGIGEIIATGRKVLHCLGAISAFALANTVPAVKIAQALKKAGSFVKLAKKVINAKGAAAKLKALGGIVAETAGVSGVLATCGI